MTEDEMVGRHHRLDGHEFEQALGCGEGQGSLACCSPWDSQESSPTPQFKASILRRSAFFIVQLAHPYMTTGITIALTRRTFVGKVMSLLFNTLSRLVITFLPRSKHLLVNLTS